MAGARWLESRFIRRGWLRLSFLRLDGQRIDCVGPDFELRDLTLPLLGTHQPSNALAAVAAARVLGVGDDAVRAGLARTRWPGRLSIVQRDPWLVLDGAHNPDGARALATSLRALFGAAPITFVIGVYADKDVRGILDALIPLAAGILATGALFGLKIVLNPILAGAAMGFSSVSVVMNSMTLRRFRPQL